MPAFVETIIVVFALIAIGYGAAATRLVRPTTGDGLSDFVFTIAVPLLLFRTIATASFDHGLPFLMWCAYFASVIVTWTTAHLVMSSVFGRDARAGVVSGVTAGFSNLVLLGVPFVTGIFGEPGLAVLSQLVSVHLPLMMIASILLFDWAMRKDGESVQRAGVSAMVKSFLRQLLSNPLIIGIFAGLATRASGIEIPGVIDRVIATLASVAGPVALFAIGVSLKGYGIGGQIPQSLVVVGLKLVLMPGVMLIMALLTGLPELPAKVMVAAASLPAGVNSWLIASRFGTGQRLASTAMTIGTALAALTTGVWLVIADAVL